MISNRGNRRVLSAPRVQATGRDGLSLIEVVVALAIFLFGVVALLNFFPIKFRTQIDSEMLTQAVFLAQLKAEEIRRDNPPDSEWMNYIRSLRSPDPPEGIPFGQNPDLRYTFCGVSLLDPVDDPGVPEDDVGVARIIILSPKYTRYRNGVVYELRFD